MIHKTIHCQLNLETTSLDYQKAYLLLTTLSILIITLTYFSYRNIFIVPLYSVAILDIVSLFCSFLCLYIAISLKNINLASSFLVMIIFALSLLFIIEEKHNNYALIYALIFPIISIYLQSMKASLSYNLAYFAILFTITYKGIDRWEAVPFTSTSFINFIAVYVIVFLLIYYYERNRSFMLKAMHDANIQLHKLSTTDTLTTLYNRRHINECLTQLSSMSKEQETLFSIILLDIDDFKLVNDTYGHSVGDSVLKQFSQILLNTSKDGDIVGRWGGEEFIVICPNTDIKSAAVGAKKLLHTIQETSFEINKEISASFGVAQHKKGQSFEELIHIVDNALYKAKEDGKKTIVIAEN